MTHAERQRQRRLAHLRGERPAFDVAPAAVVDVAAERADNHTDKAIDRGLVAWWG